MKNFIVSLIAVAISAFLLTSCKKDEPSVQEMLLGKWTFDRQIVNVFLNGNSMSDTTYGDPGDYIEFRSNNTIVSFMYGGYDSTTYAVLGKDKLLVGQSDTIGIRSVFSNSLVLGNTELNAPDDFVENFIYFYR